MVELHAERLSVVTSDGVMLVAPVDLSMTGGALIALVGPNGAGKSSLVRALAGIAVYAGSARIDGAQISAMSPLARARRIAWLPQALPPAWPVTVRDAVALGRFAYGAAPSRLAAGDKRAIENAMAACDVAAMADRRITTLSGGELARVHLARVLATEADILLADEPAAALDLSHQLALMQLLREQAAQGRLVLLVVHDIALAARCADRIIVMDHGRIAADGTASAVITPQLMRDVFAVEAVIGSRDGTPVVDVIAPLAR